MSNRFISRAFGTAAFAVIFLLSASLASAQNTTPTCTGSFVSSLNFIEGGSTLSAGGFTGTNFGTVCISLVNSTTATVTFVTNDANHFLFIDSNAFDLNINGTATASGFTFTQDAGFAAASIQSITSGAVNGYGPFDMTINLFDGFNNAVSGVTFTLTATGGTTWASDQVVLDSNSQGFDAAAHVAVCNVTGCPQSGGGTNTGFVAEVGGVGSVPEPTSVLLLGTLMMFTGVKIRRRFSKDV